MGLLCKVSMSSVVSAVQDQISSDLGDEKVILHLPSGKYYGLNEIGTRIWSLIQSPTAVSEVRDTLLNEYEVEPAQCEHDLLLLLQELANENLVEVGNAAAA